MTDCCMRCYGACEAPRFDEWDQVMIDAGYAWCRPCDEWHRPPECAVALDGLPVHWWDQIST